MKHGYAFLPDEPGRPDRLIRFVPGDVLFNNMLVLYMPETNRVVIDKRLYDALDSVDQGRALTTHTDLYARMRDGRVSIAD